ncbi:hypothetical protein FB451DRAFT_1187408 [Mycena latifolia]|nr:hypothetical protein FB451DRAFT_1187408 [Mycena latifolia]
MAGTWGSVRREKVKALTRHVKCSLPHCGRQGTPDTETERSFVMTTVALIGGSLYMMSWIIDQAARLTLVEKNGECVRQGTWDMRTDNPPRLGQLGRGEPMFRHGFRQYTPQFPARIHCAWNFDILQWRVFRWLRVATSVTCKRDDDCSGLTREV